MAANDKPHLVILVHGIRDIARWQNEVGRALEAEGLIVEHTSYGRLNLLAFLVPIDYFRRKAAARVWTDIQHARMLHPEADVSIIAHSFGTFVVTRILREQFALQLNRLLLCGSVVRYDFPFEQIQNRFTPPLVNDVGTADPWPAMAESLTTGYGSAGTFGFNRPGVRDRYHNGKSHGYFLNAGFAKTYWVPFLRDGTVVGGDVEAESPSLWVRLLQVFKIKWLILLAVVVAIILGALLSLYRQPPMAMQISGGSNFGWWSGTVPMLLESAQEPCPLPALLCSVRPLSNWLTGRRYVAVDIVGGDPDHVVSCGEPFRFPTAGESSDPVAALEALGAAYPQCVSVSSSDGWLGFTLKRGSITEVPTASGTKLLCGCDEAAVARFTERYGGSN
jgi:hypothetical protein